MYSIVILILALLPFLLTFWNVISFIRFLIRKKDGVYSRWIEVFSIILGFAFLCFYLNISDIILVDWNVQLKNSEVHSMINLDRIPTICTFFCVSVIGYLILRFISAEKQSPIISAIAMSASYCGIGLCVIWCIQTKKDPFLFLYSANYVLILIKSVLIFVIDKSKQIQKDSSLAKTRFPKIHRLLNKASNLPLIALLFTLPLMGILLAILILFGQEPNSIIKAWTETADWTFSQKVPPQNISYDEHYLCTVAAGGHKKIVKPLRIGIRHGHRVLVNRQLCIANAFEQILEEKVPMLHKIVRGTYDKIGYPLSRHIQKKWMADAIYFLMKPLEWIFLIVIYTVDIRPEDRIAVQYPHSKLPQWK